MMSLHGTSENEQSISQRERGGAAQRLAAEWRPNEQLPSGDVTMTRRGARVTGLPAAASHRQIPEQNSQNYGTLWRFLCNGTALP